MYLLDGQQKLTNFVTGRRLFLRMLFQPCFLRSPVGGTGEQDEPAGDGELLGRARQREEAEEAQARQRGQRPVHLALFGRGEQHRKIEETPKYAHALSRRRYETAVARYFCCVLFLVRFLSAFWVSSSSRTVVVSADITERFWLRPASYEEKSGPIHSESF